jgi:hypothetical protein
MELILKSNYLQQNYSCPSPRKSARGPQGQQILSICPGPAKIERWALGMPEVFAMVRKETTHTRAVV